jgi:hypothetical protein
VIYLCHFEQGVPFYQKQESQADLGEKLWLAVANQEPQLLRPRERRLLTSGFIGERFFQHSVRVSRTGRRAIFTVLSTRFHSALLEGNTIFLPESEISDFRRVIIPDQNPFMAVALPGGEPDMIRIVDLVYYYQPLAGKRVRPQFRFSLN